MKQRIMRRLRGKAGESIAETLIALLISALALIMLAGAIGAASDIIKRSNAAVKTHYEEEAGRVASSAEVVSPLIRALESNYPSTSSDSSQPSTSSDLG